MIIKNRVEKCNLKKLKDLKPGECFTTINPRLLDIGVSVYMKTDEGTSIDLIEGMVCRTTLLGCDNMDVYPVVLEATMIID